MCGEEGGGEKERQGQGQPIAAPSVRNCITSHGLSPPATTTLRLRTEEEQDRVLHDVHTANNNDA